MATTRQAERDTTRVTQDAMRKTADEATRASLQAADATGELARASADMMQRNLETARQSWEATSDMARRFVEQSMGQFGGAIGVSRAQGEAATGQATQGIEGTLRSTTALASGMQQVWSEWFNLSQKTMQNSMNALDALAKCRSGSEVVALQTDLVRGQFDTVVQSARRVAELFSKISEETTRKAGDA